MLVFLLPATTSVYAQEKIINLKYFSVEQGLSDNQVTSIIRDDLGFIWVGTRDGLNRFDGREFHVFKHRYSDSLSLCANSITSLTTDIDSMLWIGTATNGVSCYDFRTGKFRTFNKNNTRFPSNSVNVITYDRFRDRIWIGFNNGGSGYMDRKKQQFVGMDSSFSCYSILPTASDVYTARISRSVNTIIKPVLPDSLRQANLHTVNTIFISSDSMIWVGAWNNALHQLDLQLNYQKGFLPENELRLTDSGDEIYQIEEDHSGMLWIGTKLSGIQFFDRQSKKFISRPNFSVPLKTRVYALYKDEQNRMWIGTGGGLYLFDPAQNQFHVTMLPVPEMANSCHVHGKCTTAGGTELIASGCGLFFRTKNTIKYNYKPMLYKGEELQLTAICRTKNNRIYIGTNKTLFELDTASMELKVMSGLTETTAFEFFDIFASNINTITEYQYGGKSVLIISIYGHLMAAVDTETNKVRLFYNVKPSKKGKYLENLVRKIFIDPNNRAWICGVTKGLQQLTFSDNRQPDPNEKIALPSLTGWVNYQSNISGTPFNNIYDITPADDHTFWVTSQGSGLLKFNPGKPTQQFEIIPGPYQSLQGICKVKQDQLWMITSSGLINFDVKSGLYKRYDKSHGIPVGVSGYFLEQSTTYISAGFNGGFVDFNPDSIIPNNEKPEVHITKLWVMDQSSDSLLYSDLIVPNNKNFIKFYLSSNCFSFNDQTTFHYQLTGIDDQWRNNNNNPLVTYTNLPPGEYNFKYKAVNSDGIESEVKYFKVIIIPPFYQTWWFFLISAVLIVAIIWIIYRYRINQLMRLQEVRNKIARDLHDDIGSTLGSIHLYSQVANAKINKTGNSEIASILKKIEDGSQEIIGKTSDAIWVAKSDHDQVRDLIWKMENYCASLLGAAGISFHIHHDPKIESLRLNMDHRKNLFLIFKEGIHNIIKYSKADEVQISLLKNGTYLSLVVSDNGRGFELSDMRSGGNGLNNMKQRATDSGGSFEISSTPGQGTTLEARFPIHATQFW